MSYTVSHSCRGHNNNNNNKTTISPPLPPHRHRHHQQQQQQQQQQKTTHQKHLLLVRFRCTSARFSSSSHIFIHLCSAFQPVYLLLSISEKSKRTNIYMHFAYIIYIYINKFSIVCLKKLNCFYCHEKKAKTSCQVLELLPCLPQNPTRSSLVAAANGPQQYRSSWAPTEIQHR